MVDVDGMQRFAIQCVTVDEVRALSGPDRQVLFHPGELAVGASKRNDVEYFGARLAAKRALSRLLEAVTERHYAAIRIGNHPSGQPFLEVEPSLLKPIGERVAAVRLSLSHTRTTCGAVVMIEEEPG